MNNYKQYTIPCIACGSLTSKAYAHKNEGKCKACSTGEPKQERLFICPDCNEKTLTKYQKEHHYHCDNCTRMTEGY